MLVDGMSFGDSLKHSSGGDGGIFRLFDFGEEHNEFVASLAAHGVRAAHTFQQPFGDGLKQFVAGRMSQGIVDMFEAVQIQEQHRGLPSVSSSKRDGLADTIAKEQAIGQSGESIMLGQMSHLLRLRPRHAYIAKNDDRSSNLSFAVVDGESGFGNGLCVPAGPLRAPISAQLPFVQALIVLGGDDAAASRIAALAPGKPLMRASLEPDALAAAPLIGREVVAFAGIARPEKFYATLRRVGAQIVATRDFADHHPYTQREVEALIEESRGRGALLATTEKDLVRLSARQARAIVTLPVTLRFEEPASVRRILRQALER